MTKQEIAEIKKQFTPKKCSVNKICGCYVDDEKEKKLTFSQAFLALEEEEMYKYFELLRKNLTGTLGKNLMTLDFPLDTEAEGGTQEFLLRLRDSQLNDEALLDEFYDKIIEHYEYVGNYLILLIHDSYDVPGKSTDGLTMDDASDEVFHFIMACICPVDLSKPGLCYNPLDNIFQNRVRDRVVSMPATGFLFPAFNDRSSDIHSVLYYSKDPEELNESFVTALLGCPLPLSAGSQKETFHTLIEETLEEECDVETVKSIHDRLTELAEEHKDEPTPLILDKNEVKTILSDSGVSNEKLASFDEKFDTCAGATSTMYAGNIMSSRSFEVKTPDVVIKVSPDRTDLLETRNIDGRDCLVIQLSGEVTVNGIAVRSCPAENDEEEE